MARSHIFQLLPPTSSRNVSSCVMSSSSVNVLSIGSGVSPIMPSSDAKPPDVMTLSGVGGFFMAVSGVAFHGP